MSSDSVAGATDNHAGPIMSDDQGDELQPCTEATGRVQIPPSEDTELSELPATPAAAVALSVNVTDLQPSPDVPSSPSATPQAPQSATSQSYAEESMHEVSSSTALGELLPSAGIAAVAHVYAADVGVSIQNETVDAIHYDDATQLLMITKGGVVFAYDLAMDAPGHHEQLVWTYPLQEGPRVTAMRCSLDRLLLGCLRGNMLLELVELTTGITTVYKSERPDLLGFFFTEAPGADVVLVGRSGLELCEFAARRRGLHCRDRLRTTPAWYLWTHETRCCLVATGMQGVQYLQAWQFVSSGTLTLPPFLVGTAGAGPAVAAGTAMVSGPAALPMPISLPMSFPLPQSAAAAAPAAAGNGGTLGQRQVRLLKMYGRVYTAYINTAASRLELYRFFTDTVVLQLTYELFSTNIDLSVVDQVLVLHHLDTAITVLIDVAADAADMPVANPLPLAVLHPPPPPPRQPLPPAPLSPPPYQPPQQHRQRQRQQQQPTAQQQQQGPRGVRSSGPVELTQWEFIAPSTVIDRGHQAVYRLYLDLRAVAESCGNPVLLASFLQRRRSPALPELAVTPKQLLQSMLRSYLQEQLPPATLRKVFQQLCRAWIDVKAAKEKSDGRVSPAVAVAVLSPEEIAVQVFKWVAVQQQGGRQGGLAPDALHLQAALSEYLAVAVSAGLTPPGAMFALQADLLQQQGKHDQAALVVYAMAAQQQKLAAAAAGAGTWPAAALPAADSVDHALTYELLNTVAVARLLDAGHVAGTGASRASLSLVSQRIALCEQDAVAAASHTAGSSSHDGMAEAFVQQLLEAGRVLDAARAARRLRVTSVHPREMLRAAAKHHDEAAFASVYRCFRDALMPFYPKLDAAKASLMPS